MYDKYIIEKNDNIDIIAAKFNTTKEELYDINNIYDENSIREGKEIIVPINEKYFDIYKVEKGDTLYAIGREYNINPDLLALLNGLNKEDYIYPNQQILVPKSNYSYYVTTDGDTIENISKKFNCSSKEIIKENKTIYLLPGQLIVKKQISK